MTKESTSIGMHVVKRKNSFIEDNITGNMHTTCGHFKAFDSFVTRAIA
jgi:hypothetical protein